MSEDALKTRSRDARAAGRIGGFRRVGQGALALLFALAAASIGAESAAAHGFAPNQPRYVQSAPRSAQSAPASAQRAPAPAQSGPTSGQGAEIRRGYLAVNSCKSKAHDPDAFDDCLQPVIGKESGSPHVYYFMLGLELGCWRLSDAAKGKYASIYYFELRSYQEHLGVTDEQLLKATRTHDTQVRARLAYWAANRPATPVAIRPVSPDHRQALR